MSDEQQNGTQNQIALRAPSVDSGPLAHILDSGKFEQMQRIAKAMSFASLMPVHLKGGSQQETIANCLMCVNQAVRWGADPFAVAAETYVVHGRLGFQGKLVAAIVNAKAGLNGRLSYEHKGSGDNRTVIVSGTFKDEANPRTVELTVGQAKTDNKMWKTDPDQKLCYSGAIRWARRHCPEIMLGVLTDDDLDKMKKAAVIDETDKEAINSRLFQKTKVETVVEPEKEDDGCQLPDFDQAAAYIKGARSRKNALERHAEVKGPFQADPDTAMELEDVLNQTLAKFPDKPEPEPEKPRRKKDEQGSLV